MDADYWRNKYNDSQKRVRKLERGISECLLWLRFPESHMLNAIRIKLKRIMSKGIDP